MDDAYFKRVSAIDFAMRFDDGKTLEGLKEADVVLVGVSRTSKTPTSVYLARRGIKAANIPIVPGARRMFGKHGWPVIDVTKRSIEETAAEIMALLQNRKDKTFQVDE